MLKHVYEAYTPLSDQNSHQAHFHETTRAQALNHFLELWVLEERYMAELLINAFKIQKFSVWFFMLFTEINV